MLSRRFKLGGLLLLFTLFCFTLGYSLVNYRHQIGRQRLNHAKSIVEASFRDGPPGFEQGNIPWSDKSGTKFDTTFFDAWQQEISAKHRIRGWRQAAYFYAIDYSLPSVPGQKQYRIDVKVVRSPQQLKREMLQHFGNPLKSLGFVTSVDGPLEELSLGHRTFVTFVDPKTDCEVDLKFVFGRDGCTFVDIALGCD